MGSIDGVRPGAYRTEASGLPASRGSGFAVPNAPQDSLVQTGPGVAGGVNDVAVLPVGVLAAQEYGSEPFAERTARRRGMLVLHQLSRLQIALLGAGPGSHDRDQLAGLAAALEESLAAGIDPRLRALLSTLALRARIELARPRI